MLLLFPAAPTSCAPLPRTPVFCCTTRFGNDTPGHPCPLVPDKLWRTWIIAVARAFSVATEVSETSLNCASAMGALTLGSGKKPWVNSWASPPRNRGSLGDGGQSHGI